MNARLKPTLAVLPMRLADLDAVLEVEARCYSFPWTRGNFVDSLSAGYRAEVLWDSAGEVVGYCVAQPGVEEMHLLNLSVAPHWQRQGHASVLLARLLEHCQAERMHLLWLEVRSSNAAARALYARRGFAEVGLRRAYYPAVAGREDAVVMRAEVSRA